METIWTLQLPFIQSPYCLLLHEVAQVSGIAPLKNTFCQSELSELTRKMASNEATLPVQPISMVALLGISTWFTAAPPVKLLAFPASPFTRTVPDIVHTFPFPLKSASFQSFPAPQEPETQEVSMSQ